MSVPDSSWFLGLILLLCRAALECGAIPKLIFQSSNEYIWSTTTTHELFEMPQVLDIMLCAVIVRRCLCPATTRHMVACMKSTLYHIGRDIGEILNCSTMACSGSKRFTAEKTCNDEDKGKNTVCVFHRSGPTFAYR